MTADSRLDALRALLAKPFDDGYVRGTLYSFQQPDRKILTAKKVQPEPKEGA